MELVLYQNRIRGTPEYCVQTRQVRYYGIEPIDEELLNIGGKVNLIKEQLKLRKVEDDARIMINEIKKLKLIIDSKDATKTEKKRAQKKLDQIFIKRDTMVKKIKAQRIFVHKLEKIKKK